MCDTFVALANATADGRSLFAKNSDRHPNEAQEVVIVPADEHEDGARVRCSYIDIPQARRTHKTLLCKPFWCWGAEMGVNEHGLAIGNESAFPKGGGNHEPGLLGLDLVRLGLERAENADEALQVVTSIVESNPIGGNAGYRFDLFCDHSLILADAQNAWVVEIAGNEWIAERVTRARSISNRYTTRGLGDRRSADLVPQAIRKGWCASESDFDFAAQYSDLLYSSFADGAHRQKRTAAMLDAGPLDLLTVFQGLRDHGGNRRWTPQQGVIGSQVCMHAGAGPVRIAQTTGSMVCHYAGDRPTIWLTATSTPCTAIYKPVWLDAGLPDLGPRLGGLSDLRTLWWRHETFQRKVQRDYIARASSFRDERDAMEADFVQRAVAARQSDEGARRVLTEACFAEADEALDRWDNALRPSVRALRPSLHALAWRRRDKESRL